MVDEEVWVDLRLANVGFVPVFDVRLEGPLARDGERSLSCELDAQLGTMQRQFAAGQEWKGRLYIGVDRELLDDWSARPGAVELEIDILLRYYLPPDRPNEQIHLIVLLSEVDDVIIYGHIYIDILCQFDSVFGGFRFIIIGTQRFFDCRGNDVVFSHVGVFFPKGFIQIENRPL